jgi:hypothetical protein
LQRLRRRTGVDCHRGTERSNRGIDNCHGAATPAPWARITRLEGRAEREQQCLPPPQWGAVEEDKLVALDVPETAAS